MQDTAEWVAEIASDDENEDAVAFRISNLNAGPGKHITALQAVRVSSEITGQHHCLGVS